MRRTLVSAALALSIVILGVAGGSRQAEATDVGYGRKIGVGFMIGNPTGIVGKYWIGGTNAVDVGLGFYGYGWGWRGCDDQGRCFNGGYQNVSINSDYLWQSNLVKSTAQLDWHIGAGGRIDFWGDRYSGGVGLSVRAPIGVDLMFNNPNFLELFFEIAPAFYFLPVAGFGFEGGLGVRLYF